MRIRRGSEIFRDPDNRATNDKRLLELRKRAAEQAASPPTHTPLQEQPLDYCVVDSGDGLALSAAERLLGAESEEIHGRRGSRKAAELKAGIEDGFYRIAVCGRNLGFVGIALAESGKAGEPLTSWYVQPSLRHDGIGKQLLSTLGVPIPQRHEITPSVVTDLPVPSATIEQTQPVDDNAAIA